MHRVRSTDKRARRDLVWSLALTGMALLAVNLRRSRELLDEAISEVALDLQADEQNTELLRYQANAFNFRGDASLIEGAPEDAFRDYAEGLAIRQRLHDKDKSNARWARDRFYTLKRMFELHRIAGKSAEAETFRAQAIEAWMAVRPKFPGDPVLAEVGREFGIGTPDQKH